MISCLALQSLVSAGQPAALPPFYKPDAEKWADSVMTVLNPAERIAQLIMVAAWSNKDSAHIREIRKLIEDWGIGGLIFFQGGPVRQALLTNDYQKRSKVPLMIGIDGEWGLSMRLDSTLRFPRQMTMTALQDDSAVYRMGAEIARQCRRMGIHINFAPDADINNNAQNPVIGSRSFSDDREQVARSSKMYMQALQDNYVLANAKHFPGHGNVDSDSHHTLPTIHQSREGLDSMELYPFRQLISEGVSSVMVAHLHVPSLDSTANLPSTLSKPIVTGLLKEELGFKGLVFTDALNMKGVSACYRPGIVDLNALLAGNDVLLYTEDVHKAVEEILAAVDSGMISQAEIDQRVRKVLMAKYWAGLGNYQPVDTLHLYQDLNKPSAVKLQRELYERSVTLLSNKGKAVPVLGAFRLRIASVVIGDKKGNRFQEALDGYLRVDKFAEEKDASVSVFQALFAFLENYDLVILSLHGTTMKAQTGYGIPESAQQFIDQVLEKYPTVFVDFGNAYTLSRFGKLSNAKSLIIAYEDFPLTHELAAQLISGASTSKARLPINSGAQFSRGAGEDGGGTVRLKYAVPEEAGIRSEMLAPIETIVRSAIEAGAMPGCQVLVAKDGKIIYEKAFGYKTYDSTEAVTTSDLYDVASVTKIASTALTTMHLFDHGKLDLNQPLSKYLPKLKQTNKKGLVLRDVLAHQSGLPSWIPFWKETVKDGKYIPDVYSSVSTEEYAVRICDSLYMRKDYLDSLQRWVYQSPIGEKGKYVYSDLGPIMVRWAVERIGGKSFEEQLEQDFYKPLQLNNTFFRPLEHVQPSRIVPTVFDREFRHRLLRGDVHDPAAAMSGGIAGNAGLFSNAHDLAVIMQMLLNKGSYGGEQLIKPNTVTLFTRQQFVQNKNRRGLLFDKPETEPGRSSPCSPSASAETFGHQGFTGTCIWADPQYNLVYVFLSNRVHPDAENNKLAKMNVRTSIQEVIYEAIRAQ